jgi:hypothetical protein
MDEEVIRNWLQKFMSAVLFATPPPRTPTFLPSNIPTRAAKKEPGDD